MSEDSTVGMLRRLMARIVGPDQASRGEVFTSQETGRLLAAYSAGGPHTDEQKEQFLAWCHETRIRAALLDGLLHGLFFARITLDGRIEVKQPGTEGREWIRTVPRGPNTST